MELFFPVDPDERAALLDGRFTSHDLAGLDRIEWDNSGAAEDALWVAADVPDDVAEVHLEPDSHYLGYRSYVLPRSVLNRVEFRDVPAAEVEAAESAEADRQAAFREQRRRP